MGGNFGFGGFAEVRVRIRGADPSCPGVWGASRAAEFKLQGRVVYEFSV